MTIYAGDNSVSAQARRLRRAAEAGPIGQTKTAGELYGLLAACLGLVERCQRHPDAISELRGLVAQQPTAGNRRYVEHGSDACLLVCRYVFGDLKSAAANRSNGSRYAHCLRQAQAAGLTSATLARHLREQGGINALYFKRPLKALTVATKTLRLDRSIDVPKAGTVTLTLRRMPDGCFEVIGVVTMTTTGELVE